MMYDTKWQGMHCNNYDLVLQLTYFYSSRKLGFKKKTLLFQNGIITEIGHHSSLLSSLFSSSESNYISRTEQQQGVYNTVPVKMALLLFFSLETLGKKEEGGG